MEVSNNSSQYFIIYNSSVVSFVPIRPKNIADLRRQKCVSGWATIPNSTPVYVHVAGSEVYDSETKVRDSEVYDSETKVGDSEVYDSETKVDVSESISSPNFCFNSSTN
jgi:hypothetical protein